MRRACGRRMRWTRTADVLSWCRQIKVFSVQVHTAVAGPTEGSRALGVGFAEVEDAGCVLALLQFTEEWPSGQVLELTDENLAGSWTLKALANNPASSWVSFSVLGDHVVALELKPQGQMFLENYELISNEEGHSRCRRGARIHGLSLKIDMSAASLGETGSSTAIVS